MRKIGVILALVGGVPALADAVSYNAPTWDRWNYPFNSTSGYRDVAVTFSSGYVPGLFDDKDAQFLNTFITAGDIAPHMGASNYVITSARFSVTVDPRFGGIVAYDPTYDSYGTYREAFQDGYTPDTDAGRPVELYATGFRNGLNPFAYGDSMAFAFGDPTAEGVRNAYAAQTDAVGNLSDASNNVRDGFDTSPLAIGQIAGLNAGDIILGYATLVFDINVGDAGIQAWLAQSLDAGALALTVSSMHPAAQGGAVTYPGFFTNESFFPDAQSATLELTYEIIPAPASLALLGLGGLAIRRRR
ncbi:MAG: hypothetical protein DYG94_05740 [Leptolyngbya sp. PLA3]|nr:MAG: hypothetical protein EDM82_04380 [Cyanobacteria bacterium CYA]MCE7968235.1 hypothetical protein [Leptolyngbya sp. PL-A3]